MGYQRRVHGAIKKKVSIKVKNLLILFITMKFFT